MGRHTSHEFLHRLKEFIIEKNNSMIDMIRGDDPSAFTRKRKVSTLQIVMQTLTQRGKTQRCEIRELSKSLGKNWVKDITDVGFYKARMKFNPSAMKAIADAYLDEELKRNEPKKYRGFRIYAIDGSELLLPSNTKKERFATGTSGNAPSENMPVMCKLSALSDCLNNIVMDFRIDEYNHNERDHAQSLERSISDDMRKDALLLFDRGYFSFSHAFTLEELGIHYLFRLNSYSLKSFQEGMNPGEEKNIETSVSKNLIGVHMRKGRNLNSLEGRLLKARMVCIKIEDTTEFLLTDLDASMMPVSCMAKLYHMRWDIETAFRILKENLNMNEYSGRREKLIEQDICCAVWMHNIVSLYMKAMENKRQMKSARGTKLNRSNAIGVFKTYLITALFHSYSRERYKAAKTIPKEILKHVCLIRVGRNFSRDHACKNKSRMSYRSNY